MTPTLGSARRASRRHGTRARPARLAVLALLLSGSVTGCSTGEFLRLGMPEPITREGRHILSLWQGSWIAAFAVGALVWGLIVWAVIFHRKKSDRLPPQVRYNLPIEVLYMVVPFIMVSVLFYFTIQTGTRLGRVPSESDLTVRVTGFQWSWEFHYPQHGVTVVGQPVQRASQGPTLVIPEGRSVKFELRSQDVVHSFWIPAFLYKEDVIPGHPNEFAITATEQGTYTGRCSELCGTYHSRMLFTLKVVSPQEFQSFIESRQGRAQAQQVAGSTQ